MIVKRKNELSSLMISSEIIVILIMKVVINNVALCNIRIEISESEESCVAA